MDADEDWFLNYSAFELAVIEFKKRNPHIKEAIICNDGAGPFKGVMFVSHLTRLGPATGIRIGDQLADSATAIRKSSR